MEIVVNWMFSMCSYLKFGPHHTRIFSGTRFARRPPFFSFSWWESRYMAIGGPFFISWLLVDCWFENRSRTLSVCHAWSVRTCFLVLYFCFPSFFIILVVFHFFSFSFFLIICFNFVLFHIFYFVLLNLFSRCTCFVFMCWEYYTY